MIITWSKKFPFVFFLALPHFPALFANSIETGWLSR